MKPLLPYCLRPVAVFAMTAMLSACGGGGSASPAAAPASPAAPAAAPAVAPDPAAPPASADAADVMNRAYTVIPAATPTDSGGEPPYPDLRMLPTRVMQFDPVVYGDVSAVAVTPAG